MLTLLPNSEDVLTARTNLKRVLPPRIWRFDMSLQNQPQPEIPEATARIAKAAFKKGNLYLKIRDSLGTLYIDEQFKQLFPTRGQPAEAPWRLALVTIFQFLDNLTDRQAADAVRADSTGNMLSLWN
jgi:hypothetical protein